MANTVHSNITTTVFWVGEEAGPDSGYIPNFESAWDGEWLRHFGGIDAQGPRDGIMPLLFTPSENAFYFALPYNDLDANGNTKSNAANVVPWAATDPVGAGQSLVKNHWIKIEASGHVAYAQWEDVGPNGESDAKYVFGNAQPTNTFGVHAGLDVSPAVQHFLGLGDVFKATWQFVDFADVPDGPWKKTVTKSQVDFNVANDKSSTTGNDWLVGKAEKDLIKSSSGNDRIYASAGDDVVFGDAGNDRLHGGGGNDTLDGGTGNDTISGGTGNDKITGGSGADWLWGDAGKDTFDYDYIKQSGPMDATRDRIGDFRHAVDKIDLLNLDANARSTGNQAFTFIGQAEFSKHAGQLHFAKLDAPGTANDKTMVEADVNGDGHADFAIELTGLINLSKSDFIL